MTAYFVVTRQQSRQKSAPGVPPWTPLPAQRESGAAVCGRICSAAEAGTRSPRPSFGERGKALPETPIAFVQPCRWGKVGNLPVTAREPAGLFPQQKSGLLDFRRELSAGTARRGNALPETPMAFVQLCWWGKLEQGSAFDAVGVQVCADGYPGD